MRKFIWIIGPMAVGKMTVGRELSKRTNYPLFHNHQSIELGLKYFEYGTPGFKKINSGLRNLMYETIAEHHEIGFIFTYVWDFGDISEQRIVEHVNSFFNKFDNWKIYFIELEANLETRLERNLHPDRIEAKPSKKETDRTTRELTRAQEGEYLLNSKGNFPLDYPHLVINNENLNPKEVVDKILEFIKN